MIFLQKEQNKGGFFVNILIKKKYNVQDFFN